MGTETGDQVMTRHCRQRLPCGYEVLGVRARDFRVLLALSWTDQAAEQGQPLSWAPEGPRKTRLWSVEREDPRRPAGLVACPVLTRRRS